MLANILPSAAVVFLLSYPTGTVNAGAYAGTVSACAYTGTFNADTYPGRDGDPHGRAIEAAVHLSGAGSAEEMDEEELGHFLSFAAHPLPVNNSSRARLISSGLFSPYQIASLEDYRRRNGDILSFSELLSVNGFDEETVAALRCFISLESSSPPSIRQGNRISDELTLRSNAKMKKQESATFSTGLKYRLESESGWESSFGFKENLEFRPGTRSSPSGKISSSVKSNVLSEGFSIAYINPGGGRKVRVAKFIAGDFSLRMGQGLTIWNGLSFTGISSVGSLCRNASGAVPYRSWGGSAVNFGKNVKYKPSTYSLRGLASEISAGRFSTSAAVAHCPGNDLLAALGTVHYGLNHQESVNAFVRCSAEGKVRDAVISLEARGNIRGADLFGEAAFSIADLAPALLAGTRFKACERLTLGFLARYYPSSYDVSYSGAVRSGTKCSDEHAVTAAARLTAGKFVDFKPEHQLDMSFDAAFHPSTRHLQLKFQSDYAWTSGSGWAVKLRLLYRRRNYGQVNRAELRADLQWASGNWAANCRVHGLYGNGPGGLCYAEGAFRPSNMSIFVRMGLYGSGGWDDRIYVYERDAPGGFSAPAFYGRGLWTSLYLSADPCRAIRLWLRSSLVYGAGRPLQLETTLQLRFRFCGMKK